MGYLVALGADQLQSFTCPYCRRIVSIYVLYDIFQTCITVVRPWVSIVSIYIYVYYIIKIKYYIWCISDLYYGGEALGADQPQSFTCPYCSRMGLTELVLLDHVTAEHADAAAEVVSTNCTSTGLRGGRRNIVNCPWIASLFKCGRQDTVPWKHPIPRSEGVLSLKCPLNAAVIVHNVWKLSLSSI